MKRLKKYQILIIFISFVFIFFLFQISFLNILKPQNNNQKLNPKLYEVKRVQAAKQDKFEQKILSINKTEFLIPLDSNLNPHIIDLLPLNQEAGSLFKFEKIFVNKENFLIRADTFLSIEHENRIIGSDKLLPEIKIRGVDKKNQFFYQPTENNKFKCLNSNVVLIK